MSNSSLVFSPNSLLGVGKLHFWDNNSFSEVCFSEL